MLLPLILALLLGILAGTITGLAPGIHVNLVSAFLISSLAILLTYFSPVTLLVFIVAMSITHTFVDFIPSIFLGCPDTDTELSILPGHQMLTQGKSFEAVILTIYGSALGAIIIFFLTPFFIFLLPKAYIYIKIVMFPILVLSSIYLIIREKNKIISIFIFLLAGFLGLSSFLINTNNSLLPLLTGLFGSSSLITSIMKKQKIPEQKIEKIQKPEIKSLIKTFIASSLSSPLCAILPALGSGQAAVIGSDLIEEKDSKQFLILLGSINTVVAGLSFVTLYSISEARTGTAVALNSVISNLNLTHLLIILAAIFFSSIISTFLTLYLGKFFSKHIYKFNYQYLSAFVLILLTIIVIFFSGLIGLLIFITATFTGLFCISINARRTLLMGSLMLVSILLNFPF